MFTIRWTNEEDKETFNNKKEVKRRVEKIGTDGAILKWFDTSKSNGVIVYYNKVIGYVDYESDPLDFNDIKKLHLNNALLNMTQDELIVMIKEYNDYVQDNVSIKDKQKIEVRDLLIWLSVNYIE